MARVISTAFCVVLLAATAGAFALTEGAKTELSPIYKTKISKIFSPVCNPRICDDRTASIVFRLRKRQTLDVWMIRNGTQVASIVSGRTYPRGEVRLSFDGRADGSPRILPDGNYQAVVRLLQEHRTITLPNLIALDTVPPVVTRFEKGISTHISPDGDGRRDLFREKYTVNGPAHGILFVDGSQAVYTRSQSLHGVLTWNGRIDGRLAAPGRHVLSIAAQDRAGNRSRPVVFAVVTIRYLALGRTHLVVHAGRRFAVFVLTDAARLSWHFAHGQGLSRSHTLQLRAPRRVGTYRLSVTASGHTAVATVVVR